MSSNSAVKREARARQKQTGEKYSVARRNVIDGKNGGPGPLPGARLALDPETVSAVISGFGMHNLGLAMPTLLAAAADGQTVVIAAHEGEQTPWNMASPLDFLAASGRDGFEAIAAWKRRNEEQTRQRVMDLLNVVLAEFTFAQGPLPEQGWLELLGKGPSVLYIPDLQVDLPLSDWHGKRTEKLSQFDLIPVQLTGLKSLARKSGAAILGGHCMGAADEGGWRVVAEIADETILIHEDERPYEEERYILDDDHRREVRLERRSRWSEDKAPEERAVIDTSFCDWRNVKAEG